LIINILFKMKFFTHIALPVFLLPVFLFGHLTTDAQTIIQTNNKIAPELRSAFKQGRQMDFIVVMQQQSKPVPPPSLKLKNQKAQFVYDRLKETAIRTQGNVWRIISTHQATANSLYVVNATAIIQGDEKLARALAALPEVAALAPDPYIQLQEPVQPSQKQDGQRVQERSAIEWGIERINAPAVWALGFIGQGITVGGADTGYDWTHPALKPHYRGNGATPEKIDHNYNWHDAIHVQNPLNSDANNPCGFNTKGPCDDSAHGTHTMGTMTGDDGQGNQIGVAPGAKWIGCRNMERGWGKPSTYLECFEWFLAPTDSNGQNPKPEKAPHVINNSWYCAVEEGCTDLSIDSLLRIAIVNLRSSGVFVVVSNGNAGRNGCASTDGPPAYFEESFSVGATDINDKIADFSSRGPIDIDKSNRTKPNVTAPGVNIRSSTPRGNYDNYQGTSMAGPHVVGLVALVLSARPELAGQVEILEDIIEQTAIFYPDSTGCTPVADARPNNVFGFGRVNALDAVRAALNYVDIQTPLSNTFLVRVMPNPAQTDVFFGFYAAFGPVVLEIFGVDGRMVAERHWAGQGNQEFVQISLSQIPAGSYYWRVRTQEEAAQGLLVRQE